MPPKEHETDDEDPDHGCAEKKKTKNKKVYFQKWKNEYADKFPELTVSKIGSSHAFCTLCDRNFSISHGGRNDCERRVQSIMHKSANKVVGDGDDGQKITSFFTGPTSTSS